MIGQRFLVLAAALALAAPIAARADSTVELFGGGQGDYSNFLYLGATAALPGAAIGRGFAVRGIVNTGGYNYPSDVLGPVKAHFTGGELDALYQISSPTLWTDFGAGVSYANTTLTPFDPTNRRAGSQAELRLDLDGGSSTGPWRTDWFGYYGTRLYDYAARLGLTHAISPNARLGAEAYTEGDPTYHLNQVGPYVGIALSPQSELQVSGGFSWESGFDPRNYVRASFYQKL